MLQKTKILVYHNIGCIGGVRATRIAKLALLCIVALATASTIGLAILSAIAPNVDTPTLKGFVNAPKLTCSAIGKIRPMGDPINDPKPN